MKILLVSYHLGGRTAEGQVTAKLVAALAAVGHAVTAVTAEETTVAGVTVSRVDPVTLPVPRWRRSLAARAPQGRIWDVLHAAATLQAGADPVTAAWIVAASDRAAVLATAERPDVVHSRLNPAASHLAALRLKRRAPRLPWCAYFSDPWPHHRYPAPYVFRVGRLSRHRGDGQLRRILRLADSLVFPSQRLRDHLLAGPLARYRNKARAIPHLGEAASSAVRPSTDGVLRIRHAGFLMRERRVEPLFDAIERLILGRPEVVGRICVELAGRWSGAPPAVPEALRGMVFTLPWMPAAESRDWMAGADVLLLVEAAMAEGVFLPSKLADYLAARRPILALSPARGTVADALADGGGLVAPPDDPAAIAAALTRLDDLHRRGELESLAPSVEQARTVSPAAIVPQWEEAFTAALDAAAAQQAQR